MFTPHEIKNAISIINTSIPFSECSVNEWVFDSRRVMIPAEALFFAIQTTHNDGHFYIPDLLKKGVKNFIISHNIKQYQDLQANFFQVNDVVDAMQQLAIFYRKRFTYPVVGITGSNGKTIVKEWLAQLLSDEYSVVKNPNSYNSQIGVPISVWQMSKHNNMAIFEAGISQPDEMEKLAEIIKPTIGILTNIGEAHACFFKNIQEKLTEKLKLFSSANSLIFNTDNPIIKETLSSNRYHHLKKISWGKDETASYRITTLKKTRHLTLVEFNHATDWLEIPFTDTASVENALHTAVFLLYSGYSVIEINKKLTSLSSLPMRMEIKEGVNQSIIINDTYSLDINSLQIALDFLSNQTQMEKKTVILSDFAQVALKDENYERVSELLVKHNITKLITVGETLKKSASLFHIPKQYAFSTTEELSQSIQDLDFENEAILVKGARQYHFEKIVKELQLRSHQTTLQINLNAIVHNLNYYKNMLNARTKIMVMAKAYSYGLGNAELIKELEYHNIDYLAVAYVDEGVKLRKRNIITPIVVLGAEASSFETMLRYHLEPEIFNYHYLNKLEQILSNNLSITAYPIHIKVDTGMHRLGFYEDEIDALITQINKNPQLKIASVFSHLAASEDPDEKDFTLQQIEIFDRVCKKITSQVSYPFLKHILNSAGITRYPQAQYDMVRLGLGLYGFSELEKDQAVLQHTVTLKSIITQIKEVKKGDTIGYNRSFKVTENMKIAIVPIGYADGLPRTLSNCVGNMIIKGVACPIVGKISMDMTMVDVSKIDVAEDEEVIIYGDNNSIQDIARVIDKTPYEMLTAISRRVQRIYLRD